MSTIFNQIINRPIIPVVVIDNVSDASGTAQALLEGGIDIIEITLRTPAALDSIKTIVKEFPEMLVGAGTVLTHTQLDQVIDCGASFSLAPGFNREIVKYSFEKRHLFIPGILTPTEIEQGLSLGCKLFKYFPASIGGPKMLQAIAGPYGSHELMFCPTGGININNMNDYLDLSFVKSVGGSWIATQKQINDNDWSLISKQAAQAMSSI